jgi:signal transduction histidine kinase
MRFAAAGTGWLAATILLAGISTPFPAARSVIAPLSQLFTLLSAVSYYVAFSPPAALRKAWQLAELYSFLRAAAGRPPAERVRGTLEYLCPAATRAVGSLGSAVFIWDLATRQFSLRASDHPALAASTAFPAAGPLELVWRERQALNVTPPSNAGPAMAQLALGIGAHWLDLLPLASLERSWGVLVSFRLQPSLFPGDDLAVLQLFAEQTAEALETGELFDRQQDLVERLETANKELEAFSYSVSHDLRSPIRAMTGFSQMVAEDEDSVLSDPARHWLQRVQSNALRMGRLVDDLLSFSRSGRQSLNLQPVNPTALVRQVWDDLNVEQEGRQVQLEVAELPPCLADPALLRQVLANLLSNALKFTRQQPVAKITIGCTRQERNLTFFIQDNGVGFDMTYANKLFGVFQRLHNVEDFEGTGIGLAIVQRIIERHGGHVTAESNVGQGATFAFTLKGVLIDA